MKQFTRLTAFAAAAVMGCSLLLPFQASAVYTIGDVNQDGKVNALDATEILIEAARRGTGRATQNTAMETAADVNNDHIINANDAVTILRYAALLGSTSGMPIFSEYLKYPVPASTYTPLRTACKVFALDMSGMKDYTSNGEFVVLKFNVVKNAPDGSYPVRITRTDFASWDVVRRFPQVIDGEITVGDIPAEQETAGKDFTLKVNSAAGKPGEEVEVKVDLSNNPGFCGFVMDVEYDRNALTLVSVVGGKDYDGAIKHQ